MGRPRKRRREDVPPEEAPDVQPEPSPPIDSFTIPTFGDGGLLPNTDLASDLSGFPDVAMNNTFSHSIIPPSYIESFGPLPAYEASHGMDPIDPLLWDPPLNDSDLTPQASSTPDQQSTGPCSCLSLNYLALSDLQALKNFAFPAVIPRIRPALQTASTMINCTKCPMEPFSAIQNMQSLTALLTAIAERFHKILAGIDAEAIRLEERQEKKTFRVGDNSPENMHLHTGTLDCPMGYDINLDPQDWKKLAKQMLRTEVIGGGHNPMPLLGLVEELEKRQHRWHHDVSMHTEERRKLFGAENLCRNKGDEAMCLRMIGHIRIMVEQMKWE
ncbi:uncharacterized protein N0V89_005181 [Didymosphaeria variabile]|uniref:Uncharacterized protein n=1 Tax=Didymosphaeria variabile TaxID=1932322 RepID=A0A9W9CAZ1_9PLEO|nr:uncharacterized protein N0V89_005181 [Didymosphaeria variabile]KAJ4353452.1 hypothetical protein N0V89_005181 [Didymosphaeria variabile]